MSSTSTTNISNDDHGEIRELLPWYVNKTLPQNEHERVKTHLATCPTCAEELARCQTFAKNFPADLEQWRPSTSHFSAILANVDNYEASLQSHPQPATKMVQAKKTSALGDWFDWFSQSPRTMQWAFSLETAACIGLAAMLILPMTQQAKQKGEYQTLSTAETPSIPALSGQAVRLVFADDMTTSEINSLMKQIDGQIRQGPSAVGSYAIEIPHTISAKAMTILQANPKVKLAQAIDRPSQ